MNAALLYYSIDGVARPKPVPSPAPWWENAQKYAPEVPTYGSVSEPATARISWCTTDARRDRDCPAHVGGFHREAPPSGMASETLRLDYNDLSIWLASARDGRDPALRTTSRYLRRSNVE